MAAVLPGLVAEKLHGREDSRLAYDQHHHPFEEVDLVGFHCSRQLAPQSAQFSPELALECAAQEERDDARYQAQPKDQLVANALAIGHARTSLPRGPDIEIFQLPHSAFSLYNPALGSLVGGDFTRSVRGIGEQLSC